MDATPTLDRFVNVQIAPQAFGAEDTARHAVHVVVEKPKTAQAAPKVQSFVFPRPMIVRGIAMPMSDLVRLLWQKGLSRTMPIMMTSVLLTEKESKDQGVAPTYTFPSLTDPAHATHTFCGDFTHAQMKGVPAEWPFAWEGIPCSVLFTEKWTYIRVHNLNPMDGERVVEGIVMHLWDRHLERQRADHGTVSVYSTRDQNGIVGWVQVNERPARSLDTIYLDADVKQRIVAQLRQFLASRDLYAQYGVPWKRVHLFSGPPGTGKTSFCFALASQFKQHLAKLTVNPALTASHVEKLFASVPNRCFVLLEDVDSLFVGREAAGKQNLDFSTLINALDGVATKQGLVVFLTTNHVEQLDPALLRPGRVDCRVAFSTAKRPELAAAFDRLGKRWATEHTALLDAIDGKGVTIAAVQQFLFDAMMLDRATLMPHLDELLAFSQAPITKRI